MTPLIWLISGIVLIILEVATPGFVICFFGFSALTVSLLVWLIPGLGEGWQWFAFSILSIAYIILLRKWLTGIFVGEKNKGMANLDDETTGQIVQVTETIEKGIGGRVELFGVSWKATADVDIPKGVFVRVTGKENLTVTVEEINKNQEMQEKTV